MRLRSWAQTLCGLFSFQLPSAKWYRMCCCTQLVLQTLSVILQEQSTRHMRASARGRVVWGLAAQALHLDRSGLETCPVAYYQWDLKQITYSLSVSLSLSCPSGLR